jgi:hypothetical protein
LTGGSAVALINVLKAYLLRKASLKIEVKNGDKVVTIQAQNVQAKQLEQLIGRLKQLIDS